MSEIAHITAVVVRVAAKAALAVGLLTVVVEAARAPTYLAAGIPLGRQALVLLYLLPGLVLYPVSRRLDAWLARRLD